MCHAKHFRGLCPRVRAFSHVCPYCHDIISHPTTANCPLQHTLEVKQTWLPQIFNIYINTLPFNKGSRGHLRYCIIFVKHKWCFWVHKKCQSLTKHRWNSLLCILHSNIKCILATGAVRVSVACTPHSAFCFVQYRSKPGVNSEYLSCSSE